MPIKKRKRDISIPLLCLFLASTGFVCEAHAQADSGDNLGKEPGTIIISREVYYRSAIEPSIPAPPRTVDVSPDDVVKAATDLNLTPLSASESASVSASVGAAADLTRITVDAGVDHFRQAQERQGFAVGGLGGGSSFSGSIREGMGALNVALGSMRDALSINK